MKQCFLNSVGSHYRLDDVLLLIYSKVNAFFETRFRDKRHATLSSSKRMNYYEERARRARDIVDTAMQPGSDKIKIICRELGRAHVKGGGGSCLLALSAEERQVPVYKVDLSAVSCTCGDIMAVACKHILAVAMLLPQVAHHYNIGLLSSRQVDFEMPAEDFEEYVRDSLLSLSSAPFSSSSSSPVQPNAASAPEPFLSDAEGTRSSPIHALSDRFPLVPQYPLLHSFI